MNVHFWNTLKKTLTNQLSNKSGSHHFPQTFFLQIIYIDQSYYNNYDKMFSKQTILLAFRNPF